MKGLNDYEKEENMNESAVSVITNPKDVEGLMESLENMVTIIDVLKMKGRKVLADNSAKLAYDKKTMVKQWNESLADAASALDEAYRDLQQ